MAHASLTGLPDDLLLDVIEYLDTGRDVSHLGQVAKRTHRLVEQDGWKTFVKTRFPSLRAPGGLDVSWGRVADQFTYLDRCWDKRALRFSLYKTRPQPKQRSKYGGGGGPPRQAVDFHGVVDARHVSSLDREVVAFGAGEDLHVRWEAMGTAETEKYERWGSILGRAGGYSAGTGDVTALRIIERSAAMGGRVTPELVVGRANGDVEVLSAAEDKTFSVRTRAVVKLDERKEAGQLSALSISPGRLAVNCTEWNPDTDMLAASRSSHLHLYRMPDEANADLGLLAFQDMSLDRPPNQESFVRDIKFLDKDHFAVALGGNSQPIQYGTIRPTGVVFEPAAHSPGVLSRKEGKLHSLLTDVNTIVWAIQPVGHKNSRNLLLSSWQDGTFRLLDARTPSPYDAIYRDNFQPYQAGGPLLVYGTERFVTGNNTAPNLRFFDFRFDKPYSHTTVSPCSPAEPRPLVRCSAGTSNSVSRCAPGTSDLCNWHALSRTPCYRQDATLWLSYRGMDRIFSLAKPSDTSDKFYLGIRGAIAEAQLVLSEDVTLRRVNSPSSPKGWHVSDVTSVTLGETGVGLCTSSVHDGLHGELHSGMPELFYNKKAKGKSSNFKYVDAPEGSRLDTALQRQLPIARRGHRPGGR